MSPSSRATAARRPGGTARARAEPAAPGNAVSDRSAARRAARGAAARAASSSRCHRSAKSSPTASKSAFEEPGADARRRPAPPRAGRARRAPWPAGAGGAARGRRRVVTSSRSPLDSTTAVSAVRPSSQGPAKRMWSFAPSDPNPVSRAARAAWVRRESESPLPSKSSCGRCSPRCMSALWTPAAIVTTR